MSCPSFDALLAWLGDGGGDADTAIRAHVDTGCPECARRVALLDAMFASLEPAPEPVPDALKQRVLARIADAGAAEHAHTGSAAPAQPGRAAAAFGRIRDFLGELVATPPALAGAFRGHADARLRRYRAGPYAVDVALLDGTLHGQIADADGRDAAVFDGASCTLCGGDRTQTARVDASGEFRFAGTQPGRYALMVGGSYVSLILPDLDLRDEA